MIIIPHIITHYTNKMNIDHEKITSEILLNYILCSKKHGVNTELWENGNGLLASTIRQYLIESILPSVQYFLCHGLPQKIIEPPKLKIVLKFKCFSFSSHISCVVVVKQSFKGI